MFWSSDKAPTKEEFQKMDKHCWKSRSEKGHNQHHQHHHHPHHHHHGAPPTGMMAKHWEKKHCHFKEMKVPTTVHGCGGHHNQHNGPPPLVAKYLERKHFQEKFQMSPGEHKHHHCHFRSARFSKPSPSNEERYGWFWE